MTKALWTAKPPTAKTPAAAVLRKVGFQEANRNELFPYYRCDRTSWTPHEIG